MARSDRRVVAPALLSCLAILLALLTAAPAGADRPDAGTSGKPATLRILSLNTWHGGTTVPDGFQRILDTIEVSDANVVLLTESGDTTQRVADALSTPEQKYYAASSGDAGIVSAFPIIEEGDLPDMKKAVLDLGSREAAVYAAHLYYRNYATYLPRGYGGGVDEPSEFAQYGWDKLPFGPVLDVPKILKVNQDSGRPDVIRQFVADARTEQAKGRAVFLGGDFNEPSTLDWTDATADLFDHHGLTIPWQSTEILRAEGFVDSYRSRYPDPVTHPGFTWPSDNADMPTEELTWAPEADERDRIDYIFHAPRPGLKLQEVGIVGPRTTIVRNERVLENTEDNFLPTPEGWPSDHKAVLAEYRVAGPPSR